ncbi:MAG TPA: hypothetical protein VER79_00500 [Candidatus Limnocylindrales bacterium]|nr:hypothetical protein [Candidatus Limnocylindrales bacterium]
MSIPPPISLDEGWTVEYFERDPSLYEFAALGQPVPSLRAFSCSRRVDEGWLVLLTRTFDVPPILDVCLRFDLHMEAAPGPVVVYMNGRRLGEIDGDHPFVCDVTDFITLEDNLIALRVDCAQGGAFRDVLLKAEPCG